MKYLWIHLPFIPPFLGEQYGLREVSHHLQLAYEQVLSPPTSLSQSTRQNHQVHSGRHRLTAHLHHLDYVTRHLPCLHDSTLAGADHDHVQRHYHLSSHLSSAALHYQAHHW